MKRPFVILLLAIIAVESVFAGYITARYSFDIDTKTKEEYLRKYINVPESEIFSSEEDLINRLERYKQDMVNMRLFKNVEYGYVMTADIADVTFTVSDARSFIALPYPKYDSSDGLSLKVKVLDKNMFGKLGNLDSSLSFEQQNGGTGGKLIDFHNSKITFDFSMSKLPVGKGGADFFLDTSATVNLKNYRKSKVNLSLGFNKIPITKSGVTFSPTFYAKVKLESYQGIVFGGSAAFDNIKLGNTKIRLTPYASVYTREDSLKSWGPYKMGLEGSLNTNGFTFDGAFDYNGRNDKFQYSIPSKGIAVGDYKWNEITGTASLSYEVSKRVSPFVSVEAKRRNYNDTRYKSKFKYAWIGEGVLLNLLNENDFSLKISAGEYNKYNIDDGVLDIFFRGSLEFSGGRLNYTTGDFRKGLSYSISSDADIYATRNMSYKDSFMRLHGELSYFPFSLKLFNPGVRVLATASTKPFFHYVPYDLDENKEVEGYGFLYNVTSSNTLFAEYLRGIRNDNADLKAYTEDGRIAIVSNFNFTLRTNADNFFAEAYLIPFADAAVMRTGSNGTHYYLTSGLEFLFIIKAFPAYPVRISAGFDAGKVISNLIKKTSKETDYEIFFGLHHFF